MSGAAATGPLLEACYRGLDPLIRLFGVGERGQVVEHDGALSCVSPRIPQASLFNSTMFDRAAPELLDAALAAMAPVYARAGVRAWSAWVIEGETAAERIAAERGMTVDSTPRAMGAAIADLDLSADDSAAGERWDMAVAARLNERGYGVPDGMFAAAAAAGRPPGARCFIAEQDGEEAAVVISLPNGEDCSIAWVATDPEHQGRGLAKAAMVAALKAAAEDGFVTTTLQASAAGYPLYERLGYRDLGRAVNLWQRHER